MTIYYQFSGPSDEVKGFDDKTLKYLRKDCKGIKNVCVIASDLNDYETTDFYFNKNLPWFKKFIDSNFAIDLLDARVSKEQAKILLNKAECIHLMGGYTEKQNELLKYFEITKKSFSNTKVVFGTSAGAMALAKQLIGTIDPYTVLEGLACVEHIIWPHYTEGDDDKIKSLLPLHQQIIALEDDTGIRYEKDTCIMINAGYHIFK